MWYESRPWDDEECIWRQIPELNEWEYKEYNPTNDIEDRRGKPKKFPTAYQAHIQPRTGESTASTINNKGIAVIAREVDRHNHISSRERKSNFHAAS